MEKELFGRRLLSWEEKWYNKGMFIRDALKQYSESMTRISDWHELKSVSLDWIVSEFGELLDKKRMVDLMRLEYPNMLFIFFYSLAILDIYSEDEIREVSNQTSEITNILVKRTIEDLWEFFPLSDEDFDKVDVDCSQRTEISFHVHMKMNQKAMWEHAREIFDLFGKE